jgi:hypothetical protein
MVASEGESDSLCLCHQCLGHMSEKGLKVLVDRKSLPSLKFLNLNFCKYCVFGKQCRKKFKTSRHVSKVFLITFIQMFGDHPLQFLLEDIYIL